MSKGPSRKPILSEPGPPLSPLPPEERQIRGIAQIALPVLMALYLLFAGLHAAFAPTGATGYQNAPDEAAHVAYVRRVADGKLPTRDSAANDPIGYEWHQPPLYYLAASAFLPLGEKGLRVVSILCGLVGLLLIYRAGRLFLPNDPHAVLLAVGFAALLPGHIANTSTVNNDPLLELCCSWALLLCLASLRSGWTLWRAGWLGLAVGLACLTKSTGVLLLPVVVFTLWLLHRSGETKKDLLRGAGWAGLVFLAVSGWWFVRNGILYGELLPLKAFEAAFSGTAQAKDMAAMFGGWDVYSYRVALWTFQSFWAVYGTPRSAASGLPVFLPEQIYLLFGIVSAVVLAGMIRLHLRRKVDFDEGQRFMLWIQFLFLALVSLSFLAFLTKYFQTQGRYLYPAMLPLAFVFALGWRAAIPAKYRPLATVGVLSLLAVVTLAFLRTVFFVSV